MVYSIPRADFHAARVVQILKVLRESRQQHFYLSLGAAFALAGVALGDSYSAVARSWQQHASKAERAQALRLVGTQKWVVITRRKLDKGELVAAVQKHLPGRNYAHAATLASCDTRYGPGYLVFREREDRQKAGGSAQKAGRPPERLVVIEGGKGGFEARAA